MELWTAFLLGLAGSLHCAGMCGPLVMALAKVQPASAGRTAGRLCYHLGRIVVYGLLGAVFGSIGHIAVANGFQRWLSIALGLVLLAGLAASAKAQLAAPLYKWVGWWKHSAAGLLQRNSLGGQAVLGALNGLLPCGLVYVAAVAAAATGHPLSGGAYMTWFGLGTWPMMLGIHFAGHRFLPVARFSVGHVTRAAVLLMAALLILRGLGLGIPLISPDLSAAAGGIGRCH
ncbi:MAG TPA: sulfite exporter TauE/SafE family protein [Candidatus Saccharimonadales bacterium]|nr:sulfite exporter TauE/SafE family protein [Candidatus Saccharimonadales bacterium]